ncbi:MAG: polysaccharide biosynthesis/export family protein [Planctomycetes bacterium]|nr:polysaccharide biosynthesis/export family protein [Planctomycetota bacterium]
MRAVFLALVIVGCAGCRSLEEPPGGDPPPFEFRLGPGDRIRVSVWGEDKLEHETVLGPDGVVALPLIGDVRLEGSTLDEARVEVAQRLRQSVLVDPVVSLALLDMRSHVVHLQGEVVTQGPIPFTHGLDVVSALSGAGGATRDADLGDVRVIRGVRGKPTAYGVDLEAVLLGEQRAMWLLPGDVVYVPAALTPRWERWWRGALPWADPLPTPTR